MLISIRSAARRRRARLAATAAVLVLAGGVAAAHGAMGEHHMGEAAAMCLAIAEVAAFGAGALLAVTALSALRRAPLTSAMAVLEPLTVEPTRLLTPPARAGPAVLQVVRR